MKERQYNTAEEIETLLENSGFSKEKRNTTEFDELLKKPVKFEVGYVVPVEEFQDACYKAWYDDKTTLFFDGCLISYILARYIESRIECPCGKCQYYAVELRPQRNKFIIHHVVSSMSKKHSIPEELQGDILE